MRKSDLKAAGIIAAVYACLMLLGISCPIRYLTGISCAGCGMTRAWLSLLRLDISGAFSYHPLFWVPVPAALVIIFRDRIPKKPRTIMLWLTVAAFLGVYLFRMLRGGGEVVVFAPKEGLIFRIFEALTRRI